jgi:hypothetical protein
MSSEAIEVMFETEQALVERFRREIEQRMVTVQLSEPPAKGASVDVVLQAPFSYAVFVIEGVVVHVGPDGVVAIWLPELPVDLLRLVRDCEDSVEASALERRLTEADTRKRRDHYRYLLLDWTSLPVEILEACEALEGALLAYEHLRQPDDEMKGICERVAARVDAIRRMVRSPVDRKKYRQIHVEPKEILLATERMLREGVAALRAGDLRRSRDDFLRAIELDPGGPGSYRRLDQARQALARIERDS